ncbi:MAG TPA: type II toxin-antitoxin system VapC family toxin [Vicinamibacterales bacterium]|nr:type II toxin-antitoxin system VapC family toxin [Vicinamibacterales bacterium]
MSEPVSAAPIYLDSSALLKLVFDEPESGALERFLRDRPLRACSVIGRVEVMRAARRAEDPVVQRHARTVVDGVAPIRLDDALVRRACELHPLGLRALDAIHLASALALEPDIAGMVVYDKELSKAAGAAGLRTWAPA